MTSAEAAATTPIFAAAMAVETAHLLDDGLVNPHNGVSDVPSTLIAVGDPASPPSRCTAACAVWARAVLAGLFGLAGLACGLEMHVIPALQDGASGQRLHRLRPRRRRRRAAGAVAALATRRKPNPQPS